MNSMAMSKLKVLVVLPAKFDRYEGSLIDDGKDYEMHYLEISEEARESLEVDFIDYLKEPGAITAYIDRAVEYVKTNGINGVMAGHDLASLVAAAVNERCGLRGPSAESMFLCFHKYYSRKADESKLWFDYILLDSSSDKERWSKKVRYPCFIKTPFLSGSNGHFCVRNEEEMETRLASLRQFTAPYFPVYKELFQSCIDVGKYPLAMENIIVVEELVEDADIHYTEAWFDDEGTMSIYAPVDEVYCTERKHSPFAWIVPSRQPEQVLEQFTEFSREVGKKFKLRNTFCSIEMWRRGSRLDLIEVNGRMSYTVACLYRAMWPDSTVHKAAVHLACGTPEKIVPPTLDSRVGGQFMVITYGEGVASEFVDFNYLAGDCKRDGAISHDGPGAEVLVREDTIIKQTASAGKILARFSLYDVDYKTLISRAQAIMGKILLKPDLSPVV